MGDALALVVEGPGAGAVLEVKEERGLGTTLDVILYDGTLAIGDEIAVRNADRCHRDQGTVTPKTPADEGESSSRINSSGQNPWQRRPGSRSLLPILKALSPLPVFCHTRQPRRDRGKDQKRDDRDPR